MLISHRPFTSESDNQLQKQIQSRRLLAFNGFTRGPSSAATPSTACCLLVNERPIWICCFWRVDVSAKVAFMLCCHLCQGCFDMAGPALWRDYPCALAWTPRHHKSWSCGQVERTAFQQRKKAAKNAPVFELLELCIAFLLYQANTI